MADAAPSSQFTRRTWLGLMTPPALLLATAQAGRAQPPAPASAHDLGARLYNVRDFGAKGDGTTLDTAAVQSAIDACTRDGGGVVLVPAGKFQVGSVELKSNVTLRIVAGGILLGSGNGAHYHAVAAIPLDGDSTLGDGNWALLFGVDAHNVTVEGPGMIDGQGRQFWSPVKGQKPPSGISGNSRPYHLLFYRCENLTVRNLDLFQSAYHSTRIISCQHVKLQGLHIFNRVNHNNDGFHFISSEHVAISDCEIECQDDACALFGSCKFITVTNCTFSTRWSIFRFGGGVAENVTVSNCIIYTTYGCPIKFHGGPGSRFENMSFSNLIFNNVTGPITISIGPYSRRAFADGSAKTAKPGTAAPVRRHRDDEHREPPICRNIAFSNLHGTVTTAPQPLPETNVVSSYNEGEKYSCITLNCVPGSGGILENISFTDVHLTFGGGGTAEHAARRDLPPIAGEYFFLGAMPAYGFYARNSRGITLNNVRFTVATPELRPAVILDHVTDAAIHGLSAQGNPGAELMRFIATQDVLVTAPRVLTPAASLLQIEGAGNAGITIDGGDASKAATLLATRNGAEPGAVRIRT